MSVAVIFATSVKAYVLLDGKWPSATMTFNVDIRGDDGLWNTAFENAMARWNTATIFDFTIRRDTYEDPCDRGDSESGVGFAADICGEEEFGDKTLAINQNWHRGEYHSESNIIFNNKYSWNVYDGPNQTGSWTGVVDFRRVAVHELGHALGLAHEDDVPSIMATSSSKGGIIVTPQSDDIAGVRAIYGGGTTTPPPPPPPSTPSTPVLTSPSNQARDVSLTPSLSWRRATNADSYDVYFGTSSNPSFVRNTTQTSYSPSRLAPNTTYYWSIRAKNSRGTARSATYRFTTLVPTLSGVARDRAALVALYDATDGANWRTQTNWLSNRPISSWYRVTTGAGGRVTRLSLGENGLTGPLPAELGSLSDLTSLILWGNTLTGPIPAELGNLSNLTVLDLWGSAVTGPIPAELGNLSNLTVLSLGVNELTGPIPGELGSLSNLTSLILWGNELTGPLPVELTSLRQLDILNISGNAGLCAPADTAFQAWLATIDDFRGDTCATEDGVVTNRAALVALHEATDGANWTTQTNWLSNLPISSWYGVTTGAGGRVTRLSLGENGLTGPLPAELGSLSDLTSLILWGNTLTGPIPAELGSLSNLTVLDLWGSAVTGPIPAELGSLSNLTVLSLGVNELTGPIPAELGSLSNLTSLILWGNELTGPLPVGLTSLRQLDILNISGNAGLCAPADTAFQAWLATIDDFRGDTCATEDGVVTNRAALVALHEATDGANWTTQTNWLSNLPISSWYGVTTGAGGRVTRLSLGENGLTGPLPAELGSLSNLTSLILWGNTLTGPIPAELGSLSNLTVLDLWGSAVTGPIPAELGSLSNLTVLSLGENGLTGPLPAELGSLSNLTSLILWGNELTGPLPVGLTSLRQLDILNISGNAGLCAPADAAFQAWLATINDFRGDTCTAGTESLFSIPNRGGQSTTSNGTEAATRSGYGRIRAEAGSTTPSGIAIFGFRQGGVLIAEAGVPASEPIQEGRIFAEVRGPVNTGLAMANPNDVPATIRFYFTDTRGTRFANGSFELGANQQTAKFLDQAPFNGGPSVLGTFTFTSSVPVAVVALRGFTNQAGEFLMTTLPVAPLASAATDTVYFPHFTDGSGWVTQVILVNPRDETIAGQIQFVGQGSGTTRASPVTLTLDDGRTGSRFNYVIPPRSAQRFTTSNPTGRTTSGSVRATPDRGSVAPSGLVVFSFTTGGKTVSEVGVNALTAGSAFRVYAESSGTPNQPGSIRTGLAITNARDAVNRVTLEVTGLDGTLAARPFTLPLPPSGQVARFLDEIFDSLPESFSGVLRVTSTADVAIVGLRLRINERRELKMTTTPPSDETDPPIMGDRFFPHIVDSAGWSTQFILFSGTAGQASAGTLSFIDIAGEPWDLPSTQP